MHDLSFRYEGQSDWALRHISLTVAKGEMLVIMGPSGAGKSTLARCLNRAIPAFHRGEIQGTIEIDGRRMTDEGVGHLAGIVGLVTQDFEAQLFATTVTQEIAFGMEQIGVPPAEMRNRLQIALDAVGLTRFEGRDPTTLSGGEKQRLAIAATLALRPRIMIFDEPTTDLDPIGKRDVLRAVASLRGSDTTLIVIEHETAAVDFADRVLLLDDGDIVTIGDPSTVMRDPRLLSSHGVRPPDLTQLSLSLQLDPVPATVEDAAAALAERPRAARRVEIAPSIGGSPILELRDVSYEYEPGRPALTDIQLRIGPGEFIALIGHNGSGKTTLAKHFNGLLRPNAGSIRLGCDDLAQLSPPRIAATVAYVFQNPDSQIFASSVADEVAFGPRNLGLEAAEVERRVASALEAVGLLEERTEDPFVLGKGQRERLAVASMLALEPRLLVLDEPTTGLDYREQRRMMALLADLHARGTSLVIITHSPWIISEYAQRAVLMEGGRIHFDGAMAALAGEDDLLARSRLILPDACLLARRLGTSATSVADLAAQFLPAEAP